MLRLKLMWADENAGLWDMVKEQLISQEQLNFPKDIIRQISSWLTIYRGIYKGWLDNNNPDGLFDIQSKINLAGRELCKKIKDNIHGVQCYYWFDIDRSKDEAENFVWKNCPICKCILTPTNFNNINRNVCESCKIVLP